DFTYDSCKEHFAISKFLENLKSETTDQRWITAAKNLSVKKSDYVLMQPPKQPEYVLEEVKAFWLDVDLERAESERRLAEIILEQKEIELKQKEAEFVINHSKAGNQGHSLLNDQKLQYIENLGEEIEL
ncbi:3171_t:CDS:2, partial [Racocetra fulgida]